MRRITVIAIAAAVVAAALSSAAVTPASAVDTTAWRDGFPPASAISPSLGKFTTPPDIEVSDFTGRWYACANLRARPGIGLAMGTYSLTPARPGGIRADARVYASVGAAKTAFTALRRGIAGCAGTGINESEPGSGRTWRNTTTSGTLPRVIGDGMPSLFVYTRQTPTKGSKATQKELASSYQVLMLSGNTILVSDAAVPGSSKLTADQQTAVAAFATEFATTWTKANG